MGGAFMRKFLKISALLLVFLIFMWLGTVLADRQILSKDIIRLHVVADSDSNEDQTVKLKVKDAVVNRLESIMKKLPDVKEARAYLSEHLQELEAIANEVLLQFGSHDTARVTLTQECFDTRHYDTFSLPAGVYESLRVTIGSGEGKNWWCVVFPTLCYGATSDEFSDTAAGSGFDDALTGTLVRENRYEIRFFLLDMLGRVQNFFHRK